MRFNPNTDSKEIKYFFCRTCKKKQLSQAWWEDKASAKCFCLLCGRILPEIKNNRALNNYGASRHKKNIGFCSVCGTRLYHNNTTGLCRKHYLLKWRELNQS